MKIPGISQVSFDCDSTIFFMFSHGANLFFMLRTFNASEVQSIVKKYVPQKKRKEKGAYREKPNKWKTKEGRRMQSGN